MPFLGLWVSWVGAQWPHRFFKVSFKLQVIIQVSDHMNYLWLSFVTVEWRLQGEWRRGGFIGPFGPMHTGIWHLITLYRRCKDKVLGISEYLFMAHNKNLLHKSNRFLRSPISMIIIFAQVIISLYWRNEISIFFFLSFILILYQLNYKVTELRLWVLDYQQWLVFMEA